MMERLQAEALRFDARSGFFLLVGEEEAHSAAAKTPFLTQTNAQPNYLYPQS